MLFQDWDEALKDYSDIELYEPKYDINEFYKKLSSRLIDIIDGETKYKYQTSNGNEWELEDPKKENDIYKRVFRKEELEKLINDRDVTVSVNTDDI